MNKIYSTPRIVVVKQTPQHILAGSLSTDNDPITDPRNILSLDIDLDVEKDK